MPILWFDHAETVRKPIIVANRLIAVLVTLFGVALAFLLVTIAVLGACGAGE